MVRSSFELSTGAQPYLRRLFPSCSCCCPHSVLHEARGREGDIGLGPRFPEPFLNRCRFFFFSLCAGFALAARGKSPAGLVVSAVGPDARCADRGDAGSSSRRRYTADGPTPPQPEGRQRSAAAGRRYSSSPMSKHRLLLEPCQRLQIPGAQLHATFTTGC